VLAVLSNFTALLFEGLNETVAPPGAATSTTALKPGRINWCGFYFVKPSSSTAHAHHGSVSTSSSSMSASQFSHLQLVLGPFQGRVACMRIAFGDGVCGTAWKRKEAVVVPNVHEFPGHIACDDASQAEIVVPILNPGSEDVLGVLDIDSNQVAAFDDMDRDLLVRWTATLVEYLGASELDFRPTTSH